MPTPTKFTAEVRQKIYETYSVGASTQTVCAYAGISDETMRRWLERGKDAEPGSRWREFYDKVAEAKAHPRIRALGVVYRDIPDNSTLAWKFIERREPGYAPPMPMTQPQQAPVVIQLALADGSLPIPALPEVIEDAEVVDEQDSEAEPAPEPGL